MSFLKSIWRNNSKHKKLSEELTLQNSKDSVNDPGPILPENESDVVTFNLKYLGSTIVEKVIGENISVEAVKKILKIAKTARKKLQRVNVTVSLKGIEVSDTQGNELFKISIYRISNCSTDASHRQVFSFISTDEHETMECHAFLCPKRKMAETVTLACAHAFSTAYQAWRILPEAKQFEKNVAVANENMKNALKQAEQKQETMEHNSMEEKLIDFEDDDDVFFGREESVPVVGEREKNVSVNNQWVCFDDDFGCESQRRNTNIDLIFA